MPYLLIRHRVADFTAWKAGFDAHRPTRKSAGLEDLQVLRAADDPADVVLLFKAKDTATAKAFADSPDLRDAMTKAGVIGQPTISVLTE